MAPGGCMVVNESMVNRKPCAHRYPCGDVTSKRNCAEIGNERATNMVMLGALLANTGILPEGALEKALKNHTAQRLQKFVEMNIQALRRGGEYQAS